MMSGTSKSDILINFSTFFREFLNDVKIVKVLFILNETRRKSGDVRIWVETYEDAERALRRENSKEPMMGRRIRVR